MLEDFDKIFKGIYSWLTGDKCFHGGVQLNSSFINENIVTGTDSGAIETITSIHKFYFKYTKASIVNFSVGEKITSNTGAESYVKWINELAPAVGNRFYLYESPEQNINSNLPYITYFYEDGIKIKSYNTEYKNMEFLWNIFDNNNSSLNIINLYEKLETLLRHGRYMSIEGHTVLDSLVEDEPVFTRDENKFWKCTLKSRLFVEKLNLRRQ